MLRKRLGENGVCFVQPKPGLGQLCSVRTGPRMSLTSPSTRAFSSMIGMVCASLIQGIVRSTRSRSPPEQKRIGSLPSTRSAPFNAVDLPAMS